MRGLVKRLFLSCIIVSILATPALSQDRWASNVRAQLRRQATALRRLVGNVTEAYEPYIQSLRQGYHHDISYRLNKGTTYVITGACDEDCRDLDFELRSGEDVIESDLDADDNPVIVFTPPWTGKYVLRAKMIQCSRAPCRYGVGVFQ